MKRLDDDITRRTFLKSVAGASFVGLWTLLALPSLLEAKSLRKAAEEASVLLPERKPRAPRLLMLDPGHGGHDPGAIGLSGTQEKDITLDLAQRMADALIPVLGVDVRLTRERDVFLPLKERVRLAQAARADLFISIHADSAPSKTARGLSVYSLSEKATDNFSKELADKENNADLMGGLDFAVKDQDVAEILYDLTARRTTNTALKVRMDFVHAVGRRLKLLENPMRAANFAVLRAPDVPSLLIETGFLSNKLDETMLRRSGDRQKIARLMAGELGRLLDGPLFG